MFVPERLFYSAHMKFQYRVTVNTATVSHPEFRQLPTNAHPESASPPTLPSPRERSEQYAIAF
jgi:hypothetical protein